MSNPWMLSPSVGQNRPIGDDKTRSRQRVQSTVAAAGPYLSNVQVVPGDVA
jgi:hypothetical protein